MRLTQFAKSAGCAGKLGPGDLDLALKTLPRQNLPGVLVGYENADDAGVFQLTSDISVVQTIDYFPPIVDDPYTFGQIAATDRLELDARDWPFALGFGAHGGHGDRRDDGDDHHNDD